MGVRAIQCLILLLGFLLCSGTLTKDSDDTAIKLDDPTEEPVIRTSDKNFTHRLLYDDTELQSSDTLPQMDVVTPIATVPVINPANPTATMTPTFPSYNPNPTPAASNPGNPMMTPVTTPYSTPTTATPVSSGQSWCVASQTASQTALQVALDYACGYGGADCSAIQPGGSCYNPNTLHDHASYAFNNYYQKNPIPTSCDFGGTAVITNVDPSTQTCQYPSTSTSSSVLNTTYPPGSTVFGSIPPPSTYSASTRMSIPTFVAFVCLVITVISSDVYK
ncbi:Glucan endo-1,3-beta-glucosidase 1 [Ananas comosus]|uniref:Glucan endo-1,3-beta-glucosidase 1 n=1 Tax=Ananas comosus TaxID=4615 RepID=A0A199VTB9_ANACO|nr:Glucan endo-1,3-beta-glucosidase 1 [Ananas comosus]